jgi:hypothetical protein
MWGDAVNDFDEHCLEFWDIRKRQAYNLISASKAAIEYFEECIKNALTPIDLSMSIWVEVARFTPLERHCRHSFSSVAPSKSSPLSCRSDSFSSVLLQGFLIC